MAGHIPLHPPHRPVTQSLNGLEEPKLEIFSIFPTSSTPRIFSLNAH